MGAFLQQVFALLTANPGSLAYNLVLAFSIVAAFLATLVSGRSSASPMPSSLRRTLLGLSLLFILRLVLFVFAGFAWQGMVDAALVLPVLERGVDLLSLLVIAWLWAFPAPNRAGDVAFGLLGLLLAGLTWLGVLANINLGGGRGLNGTLLDQNIQKVALFLAGVGILLLLVRRPAGWPTGLVMLALLGAGHLIQIMLPGLGDYPGAVRLTQMIAYPLLIVLPYRPGLVQAPAGGLQPEPVDAIDSRIQHLVMAWLAAGDPRQAGQALAATLAGELRADMCLFLWPPDSAGKIAARYGFNLVRNRPIPDFSLDSSSLPVITPAFQQGQALRLPANSTAPDLLLLSQACELKRCGPLLSIPVIAGDGQPVLQVMLLAPYSNRRWSPEDQQHMAEIARPLAQLLQRNWQIAAAQAELAQTRQSLQSAQDRMLKAENDRTNLIELVSALQPGQGDDQPAPDFPVPQDGLPENRRPEIENGTTAQPTANADGAGIERNLEQ